MRSGLRCRREVLPVDMPAYYLEQLVAGFTFRLLEEK
jgi:hypothetical protein